MLLGKLWPNRRDVTRTRGVVTSENGIRWRRLPRPREHEMFFARSINFADSADAIDRPSKR
jgi:hypothetical protein